MLKAIIFDFDGVLGDTYAINFGLSKMIDKDVTKQIFEDHHKGNVFEKAKIKFKEEDIPVFFERQKKMFSRKHLFPLKSILEKLSKRFKLFVISSSLDENILYFLGLKKYDRYFTQILGSSTHRSKIEKFRMIFNNYNLIPSECLFVTDTTGDIVESKKVRVRAIAVTWGYHSKELLSEKKPYAVVDTPQQLLEFLLDQS